MTRDIRKNVYALVGESFVSTDDLEEIQVSPKRAARTSNKIKKEKLVNSSPATLMPSEAAFAVIIGDPS